MAELLYHHSRLLEHVHHGLVTSLRLSHILPEPVCDGDCHLADDQWHDQAMIYEPAYEWLAKKIGFWPLFLAVGNQEEDLYMTGYQNQFRRLQSRSFNGSNKYYPPGQQPNEVLFSFSSLPQPKAYNDYLYWYLVLNGGQRYDSDHQAVEVVLSDYATRLVLKPSWSENKWLKKAKSESHSVQVAVPQLDLRQAERIYCRNQKSRQQLIAKGFPAEIITTKKLKVDVW